METTVTQQEPASQQSQAAEPIKDSPKTKLGDENKGPQAKEAKDARKEPERTDAQDQPDKYSRQQKVYLKQQAELRKEREEFQSQRQQFESELQQKRAEVDQFRQWQQDTANGNPWSFLKANNYDLDKLYKLALADEQDPNKVATQVAQELEKKFQAKFDAIEEQRRQEQEAQFQQGLNGKRTSTLNEIKSFIDANRDQLELTSVYDKSDELILEVIYQAYENSDYQTVMPYDQAAMAVENYLEEQEIRGNPLMRTGKAKKYLLGSEASSVIKNNGKKSADRNDRRKQATREHRSTEPRTISNKMSSVATPATSKETFAQRKARMADELANRTWKPKPQFMAPRYTTEADDNE